MNIEVQTIKSYKCLDDGGYNLATILLEPAPTGGKLSVISSYGNWSYYWGSTGGGDFRSFLAGCDKWYLMGKLDRGGSWAIFDGEGTVKMVKSSLLKSRREKLYETSTRGLSTVAQYRDLWDSLKDWHPESHRDFVDDLNAMADNHHHALLDSCGILCPAEADYATKENPGYQRFWDTIWVPLVAYWKQEMAEKEMPSV